MVTVRAGSETLRHKGQAQCPRPGGRVKVTVHAAQSLNLCHGSRKMEIIQHFQCKYSFRKVTMEYPLFHIFRSWLSEYEIQIFPFSASFALAPQSHHYQEYYLSLSKYQGTSLGCPELFLPFYI